MFIALEGMDASGKTSVARYICKRTVYIYNKGLKSEGVDGLISKIFPNSLTLLFELYYQDKKIIRPLLRRGETIIQDRWYYTILSYNSGIRNRIEKKIFNPIIKSLSIPDMLFYLKIPRKEQLQRLYQRKNLKEYYEYLNNPSKIRQREENLESYYNTFSGRKYIIDTTGKSVEESAKELSTIIRNHSFLPI